MRRTFIAAVVSAAVLLLAAPAFAGMARQATGSKPMPAPHMPRKAASSSRSFAPLGARLASTVTVAGKVYDSSHSALADVPMQWWSWSETDQRWYVDDMTSQADGSYSGSPLATDSGEIWAYPDDDTVYGRIGQIWTAGNSYPVNLYPGRVTVSATRGGPWHVFQGLTVALWGDTAYSYDAKATADSTTSPATVEAEALDGAYTGGSVNFWVDEGVEFSDALTVTSGTTSSGTIDVTEVGAQRVQLSGLTYSGKPGATVRVSRVNFPAGWRNAVSGYSDPSANPSVDYGTKVSQGGVSEALSVKVPGTAKPGYIYWIGFQHVGADGANKPLYIEAQYQVCTMKPSKTSVTKNTRIRVSGIVPTQGHWGSEVGQRKQIALWYHKGAKGVPTKWDPRSQGWKLINGVKTKGTGSYATPYFKLRATGTLVVQYDSDDWYAGGYTSTARVKVR
jgi:hypothetical protein